LQQTKKVEIAPSHDLPQATMNINENQTIFFQIPAELHSDAAKREIPPTPETFSVTEFSNEDGSLVRSSPEGTPLAGDVARALNLEAAAQVKRSYPLKCTIVPWEGDKFFSDYIQDALKFKGEDSNDIVMVYECPSSSSNDTSFYNCGRYRIHDYPPTPLSYKAMLRPLRYASMNGNTYPSFLVSQPPMELLNHWAKTIPNFDVPEFINEIPDSAKVNAYLPMEQYPNDRHINDPDLHYFLAGKAAINCMTDKTTRLLPNTKDVRPCVAKVTHAMGSLGIFIIRNDDDEAEFEQFVQETGNPTFVITEFVNIKRNVSCHFFIHPNGEVIWFGSSENLLLPNGSWSSDSTIDMVLQDELRELQAPYAKEVAEYCLAQGYWGFGGIDVLVDQDGIGYVCDVNPRVTGTMPALMVAKLIEDKYGFVCGKFRKSSKYSYDGPVEELFRLVDEHNEHAEGESRVVIFSICVLSETETQINVGAFSNSHERCEELLDRFAKKR
jgi:hypothetical protein